MTQQKQQRLGGGIREEKRQRKTKRKREEKGVGTRATNQRRWRIALEILSFLFDDGRLALLAYKSVLLGIPRVFLSGLDWTLSTRQRMSNRVEFVPSVGLASQSTMEKTNKVHCSLPAGSLLNKLLAARLLS